MKKDEKDDGRLKAVDVEIGYHPDGYRIDKTASPMDRYTQWDISPEGEWTSPNPVCFHALPETGWIAVDRFDWNTDRRIGSRRGGQAS